MKLMTDLNKIQPNSEMSPGLYILATPIGNLLDLSIRAKFILESADAILCENTLHTSKLLKHYDIRTTTIAYHEHNASKVRPKIINRLVKGEVLALVSDAGTPLLADPGYKLVRDAIDNNIMISGVPGPNAGIFSLVISGLPTNRYLFLGFLSAKSQARKTELKEFSKVNASLIIYESPLRLHSLLKDAYECLGMRDCAVARELTKYHEEVKRGTLFELANQFSSLNPPKGEITLVIGPPNKYNKTEINEATDKELNSLLTQMSVKDAVNSISGKSGIQRRLIYERAIYLKNKH